MISLPEQRRAASLLEISTAPEFFADVRHLVEAISSSGDEIELASCLRKAAAGVGADASYFMTFLREDRAFDTYRLLQACDPLWGLEYARSGSYANDPWLDYAMVHSKPARTAEIACANEAQLTVVQLAQRYGFRSVVVVPAPAGSGLSRLGVLVLGSERPGFFESDGYAELVVLVRAIAMELHERCAAFARCELTANRQITADEIALLGHEQAGRSSKTIARLLGTSPGAVDARFRRLNVKLRSPNRRVSARLAAEYGLIGARRAEWSDRRRATPNRGAGP